MVKNRIYTFMTEGVTFWYDNNVVIVVHADIIQTLILIRLRRRMHDIDDIGYYRAGTRRRNDIAILLLIILIIHY